MFFLPFLGYAFAEWLASVRGARRVERRLGKANIACAGLMVFGLAANIGEALYDQKWPDAEALFWMVAIFSASTIYLAASGWLRLRWNPAQR